MQADQAAVPTTRGSRSKKAQRRPQEPGLNWIDTEETMRVTGAKSRVTLIKARTIIGHRKVPGAKKQKRKKRGFACGTKLLPLHAKVFMIAQEVYRTDTGTTFTRITPEVFYFKAHAEAIGKEAWAYTTRSEDVYIDPADPKKRRFLYASGIRRKYGWRDTTLSKWRVTCPALGRKIEAREVPSRYSNRETEWVYLECDLDTIQGTIGGVNWKRKAKGKLKGRARGEHGRLLPVSPASANGNGHAATMTHTREAEQRSLPPRVKKNPRHRPLKFDPAADAKFVLDWKASGMTLGEFARHRNIPFRQADGHAKRHRERMGRK